jgi:hypothetical protein
VRWLAPTSERFAVMGALAIVLDVALIVFLVATYAPDITGIPRKLLSGLGHLEFVGMMTNLHFAILVAATQFRRGEVWPWVEDVLFWGLNVGWIGFVAGLLARATWTTPVFTPILGISILFGIAAFAVRLRGSGVATPRPAAGAHPLSLHPDITVANYRTGDASHVGRWVESYNGAPNSGIGIR